LRVITRNLARALIVLRRAFVLRVTRAPAQLSSGSLVCRCLTLAATPIGDSLGPLISPLPLVFDVGVAIGDAILIVLFDYRVIKLLRTFLTAAALILDNRSLGRHSVLRIEVAVRFLARFFRAYYFLKGTTELPDRHAAAAHAC